MNRAAKLLLLLTPAAASAAAVYPFTGSGYASSADIGAARTALRLWTTSGKTVNSVADGDAVAVITDDQGMDFVASTAGTLKLVDGKYAVLTAGSTTFIGTPTYTRGSHTLYMHLKPSVPGFDMWLARFGGTSVLNLFYDHAEALRAYNDTQDNQTFLAHYHPDFPVATAMAVGAAATYLRMGPSTFDAVSVATGSSGSGTNLEIAGRNSTFSLRGYLYGWGLANTTHDVATVNTTCSQMEAWFGGWVPDKTKPLVVICGDSRPFGYGVTFAQRLSQLLQDRHPEWQVYNDGCGSQTATYMSNRVTFLDSLTRNTGVPRILLSWEGVNSNWTDFATYDAFNAEMMARGWLVASHTDVFGIGKTSGNRVTFNASVGSSPNRSAVVDLEGISGLGADGDIMGANFQADHLHISAAGYILIADADEAVVEGLLV